MKRFKLFFYPIYLLMAATTLYYSIDILTHQQSYMEKIKDFGTLKKIPEYMLIIIMIVSVLMLIEITVENIHLFRWKRKAASNEEEVMKLKAKLYDKDSSVLKEPVEDHDDNNRNDSEDEDNDYLGLNEEEEKD